MTGAWAVLAGVVYTVLFLVAGQQLTASLTDLESVRQSVAAVMPMVIVLPLISVWCFHFDGVYIGATAAGAMMVTMGISFIIYLLLLDPLTSRWGLAGLWGAVLIFMAARGITQWLWYPFMLRRIPKVTKA